MNTLIAICLLVPLRVLGHGQLTVPLVRGDSQGRRESYEQRAPVFTIGGNRDGYSATSMRCHDFSPDDTPQTTLQAGDTFEATWTMEAGHPGDCYFYLSYDSDPNNAVNFFKFAAIPGCGATDGLNIPASVTTTVLLPPEVPACEHCVLRWEWTAHQQVVDIEFYVQCADVKITSSAGPTLPSPTTAIAGIEHLPQDASGYRKVYNGQGPEQQYLVGPPVATYSICSIGAPGCISEVGLELIESSSTSQPATSASVSSASPEPQTTASTGSDGAGECTCTASTEWNGGFARYAMGEDFCSQNFGGANPWISGGSNGGFSGPAACTKEYTFKDNHWQIFVGEDALGKAPHRAFAYAQFCNGKAYKECWTSEKVTFSFSLMVEGLSLIGAYVKVLFWTDAGNILGLLPSSHPKGEGKLRLITFMTDDYPNSWTAEKEIEESVWYHIQVVFTPATGAVELQLDSQPLDSGSIPVNMLDATTGPQMGVYSFDYATQSWPADGLKLYLGDACIGTASGTCPSGTSNDAPSSTSAANPSSEGTISSATTSPTSATSATSPTGDTSTVTASSGEVEPSTSRAGVPAQGNFDSSTCPLPGMGLPSFVAECYCGFVTSSAGDGCGPDDGTACWCRCCCHFRGGTCRYSELEVFDSSRTFALCKWVMLMLAMLHGFSA